MLIIGHHWFLDLIIEKLDIRGYVLSSIRATVSLSVFIDRNGIFNAYLRSVFYETLRLFPPVGLSSL